jgi:hypothetical protein
MDPDIVEAAIVNLLEIKSATKRAAASSGLAEAR